MTNIPDARNRILQTAIKIFANKSFEGSRIDEISREANVPKSLIYYHFKSKEDILTVLISEFLNKYELVLQRSTKDCSNDMKGRLTKYYYDFAIENADLLRIMMVESLKKNNENPVIFQVLELLLKNDDNTNKERLVAEFFSGMLPLYSYICFHEAWCKHFDMEKKEFDQLFLTHFEETHGLYHKNKENHGEALL